MPESAYVGDGRAVYGIADYSKALT